MKKTKKIKIKDSIAILESVKINDFDQYLLIRGNNINNPIILFLHGGPGGAQIGFARSFQKELEKDYVVVQWDQRGAGLSYKPNMTSEELTIPQLVEDTLGVTKYLLDRFNQKNLILVGHSFGTILGMKAIQAKPEYYSHYYGIGQIGCAVEVPSTVMEIMLNKLVNTKRHKKLLKISDPDNMNKKEMKIYQKSINYYKGGISYQGNFVSKILFKSLFGKEYNFKDTIKMIKGQIYSINTLEKAVKETDLIKEVPSVNVDITLISGKHDLLVPEVSSKKYFDVIASPNKKYYVFENSSHSAIWEEHDKFLEIIQFN